MSSLPTGWEINVIFNFFVFDQLQDKYFTIQDGKIRRFHSMKTEWGISKILDLETFRNPSNGHLINNTCVLGEEVFVVKNTFKGEFLSKMEESTTTYYHTCMVKNFKSLTSIRYISESFGPDKWTGPDIEKKVEDHMFCPTTKDWGFTQFMSLDTLKDPEQGYLVDDSCIIEAEVELFGSIILNKS
ncbi:hypothetical protein Pint_16581 [Pistacia integerrima]|uniref:Uncharacterized protein n=1 Tax=Pistacia integerrima TaxID=434235 RepID=A0ACC0ZF01_9ROSI|nr:hypothetical protein Pint_16581 [Pistacia integerrima]